MWPFRNKSVPICRSIVSVGKFEYDNETWVGDSGHKIYIDGNIQILDVELANKFKIANESVVHYSNLCFEWLNKNIARNTWLVYAVLIDSNDKVVIEVSEESAIEIYGFSCGLNCVSHEYTDD